MKVIASERFPGPAFDELLDVEILERKIPHALGAGRPDVDALAAMNELVDDRALDLLPNLRVVAVFGAGYDTVDVRACARRGVAVTNTPSVVDGATADIALALMLACRRQIVHADALLRSGSWIAKGKDVLRANEVHHSTLGIVGCGRIGQAVARRARGFEMEILYTQRTRLDAGTERELGIRYRELDELLAAADVVSLHCPLTVATRGLIDARRLALMRDGACLINTARGGVVDEPALVAELVAGRLSAGLDVFADEPHVPEPLLSLSNVVLSPHLGTATTATREAMTRRMVDNLLAAADGRPLITPVDSSAS